MTEQELYQHVVLLRKETDELIDAALDLPPTVELCVFTGKLGAVFDVLCTLEAAGAPIHDPGDEPAVLEGSKRDKGCTMTDADYLYAQLGVRQRLIEAFEAVMTTEQATEVVEALDGYLEAGSDRAAIVLENLTPNYRSELEKLRAERDTAVDFAEQLLKKAQEALASLRLPEKGG